MWPFKRGQRLNQQERRRPIDALIQQSQSGTSFDFENTPGVWVEYDFPLSFTKRLRIYLSGNITLQRVGWTRNDPEYMPPSEFRDIRLRLLRVVQPGATVRDLDGGLDSSKIRFHRHYIAFSQRLGETPDIHSSDVVYELLPILQELAGWDALPEVTFGPPPNAGNRWSVSS